MAQRAMNRSPEPIDLVEQAVLAPSSHNTQPWLFRIHGHVLELWADRTRGLPVNDPRDRELTISCGAALLNARVAAAHFGAGVVVESLPIPVEEPDLLARVELRGPADAGLSAEHLLAPIAGRHTHRGGFRREHPDEAVVRSLAAATEGEGAWFADLSDQPRRDAVVALVHEGDRAQFADPRWRRELAAWMRPRRAGDGLVPPTLAAPVARAAVSRFDVGRSIARRDARLAAAAPLLVALGTDGDEPHDWLAVGQALQRVLLTAAAAGLQAGFLNQPCQVSQLRPRLAQVVGIGGHPQVVLRLGRPRSEAPAAPRRPVRRVVAANDG